MSQTDGNSKEIKCNMCSSDTIPLTRSMSILIIIYYFYCHVAISVKVHVHVFLPYFNSPIINN